MTFAGWLDENWAAHQRLHDSCATPRLRHLIAAGKQAGAIGAKVAGAGGGGCIAFFCPEPEARADVFRSHRAGCCDAQGGGAKITRQGTRAE